MNNNRHNGTASVTPTMIVLKRGRPKESPQPVSREAKLAATAVLEVLAGVRTPNDAAVVTGLSLARYYLLEQRALEGLVAACEPRGDGRISGPRCRIAALEKEVSRLRQECTRHQALARAAQRTISLPSLAVPKPVVKSSGKAAGKAARKRRPAVRALKALTVLKATSELDSSDSSGAIPAEVLQRSSVGMPQTADCGTGVSVCSHTTAGNQFTEE
jgi:hypothetical protein